MARAANPTRNLDENDRKRFASMALPLADALFRAAYAMTGAASSAEDLVQDTYQRAMKNLHLFKPGTNFKAWIFTVMTNLFRNQLRSKAGKPSEMSWEQFDFISDAGPANEPSATPGSAAWEREYSDEMQHALDCLPQQHREVVMLALVEDFSYRQIASMLKVPIGTVMSRLYRGRQMLQEKLAALAGPWIAHAPEPCACC